MSIYMIPVDFASRVAAFGYDVPSKTLRVKLKTGEMWDYPAFPVLAWEELMAGVEDGNRTLDYLERQARRDENRAARLVSPTDELPTNPGARLQEMGLRREFGMPGTPSRERYDALVREREAMPVSTRAAELNTRLEAVRAELAAVTWQSKPGDLAALQLEENAVLHILSLCEPAYQEIDMQIEALRASVAHAAEATRKNALASQARKLADFAQLHLLKGLLRANVPPSFFEMDSVWRQRGMDLPTAWARRNSDWESEVVRLRAALGLPQEVKPELPPRRSAGAARAYDGLREESRRAEDAKISNTETQVRVAAFIRQTAADRAAIYIRARAEMGLSNAEMDALWPGLEVETYTEVTRLTHADVRRQLESGAVAVNCQN